MESAEIDTSYVTLTNELQHANVSNMKEVGKALIAIVTWLLLVVGIFTSALCLGAMVFTTNSWQDSVPGMIFWGLVAVISMRALLKRPSNNPKSRVNVIAILCVTLTLLGLFASTRAQAQIEDQPSANNSAAIATPPTSQELLELVNKERGKNNVQPLVLSQELEVSAQFKADDMNNRNYFGHDDPATGKKNGIDKAFEITGSACAYISENITQNLPDVNTSYQAITSWVGSPAHHAAMIDSKYTYTGFGVSGNYIVEQFCQVQ